MLIKIAATNRCLMVFANGQAFMYIYDYGNISLRRELHFQDGTYMHVQSLGHYRTLSLRAMSESALPPNEIKTLFTALIEKDGKALLKGTASQIDDSELLLSYGDNLFSFYIEEGCLVVYFFRKAPLSGTFMYDDFGRVLITRINDE